MAEANKRALYDHVTELGVADDKAVADLINGSQLGIGIQAPMLDAATPLVFTPTVLVVLQTPTMYDGIGKMPTMIKSVIEGHAKAVTGIDFGYTLNTATTPVGHDSQEMAVPTNMVRSAVAPSFTFQEVTGNLIFNIFHKWQKDIQHPDTNASMAHFDEPKEYIMSTYAMTMLAIQFDPTMRADRITEAACYTNMFPTSTGQLGLERTINNTKIIDRTIEFSAIVQHGDAVRAMAKNVAKKLNIHKVNYNVTKSFTEEVNSTIEDSGFNHEVTAALEDQETREEASTLSS
jgi:hypothetical protein